MVSKLKTELGDLVHADYDEDLGIVLTTQDGFIQTNRIVLGPEIYKALIEFHAALVTRKLRGEIR